MIPLAAGNLLDVALSAWRSGLCVVPAKEDGSKRPDLVSWARYQRRLPTEVEVRRWFSRRRCGLGVLTGAASGNLEMLEFEGRAVELGIWDAYKEAARAMGLLPVLARVMRGYGERSPTGGIHLFWRAPTIEGNLALAQDEHKQRLIETRGQGGFVVIAPSQGGTHPSGRPYELLRGGFDTIANLEDDERRALLDLALSFDQSPRPEWEPPDGDDPQDDRPGDDFNQRADWARDILEPAGWKMTGTRSGRQHWYRNNEGRAGWTSATISPDGAYLFVFSTSTQLPDWVGISKFRAYALLHHGGDFSAAARAVRAAGYGGRQQAGGEIRHGQSAIHSGPTSILEVTALADIDQEDAGPELLARSDGQRLLYGAGRIHHLIGPPGGGKTWLALIAVVEVLQAGARVIYVDYENGPRTIGERLRALGVDIELLARCVYVRQQSRWEDRGAHEVQALVAGGLGLAVIDGVDAAMGGDGLNPNVSGDYVTWLERIPLRLQRSCTGPLLLLDHTPKADPESGMAGGSGHKTARSDVVLNVTTKEPFGRGREGVSLIHLGKDRPGFLYSLGTYGSKPVIARFRLRSDNGISWSLEPGANTTDNAPAFMPTVLMERVSRLLEEATEPVSRNTVETEVRGRRDYVRVALDQLVEQGFVERSGGGKKGVFHRSLRPFRPAEITSPNFAQLRPGAKSASGAVSSPSGPPPIQGGPRRGEVTAPAEGRGAISEPASLRGEADVCPRCGNTSWSFEPDGRRKCAGPNACGQIYGREESP